MLGNLSSPVSSRVHEASFSGDHEAQTSLLGAFWRCQRHWLAWPSGLVARPGYKGGDGWMDGWLIELSVKLVGLAKMQ